METTWLRPVPVSRAAWQRVGDGALAAASSGLCTLRRLWSRWQASRRQVEEMRALRQLSPSVLRDIGAAPGWVDEAQRWHDPQQAARDAFLRGL